MMLLKKFVEYLNPVNLFRKSSTKNFNLRMMHGINRISILMFLICIVIMLIKFVF